MSNLLRFSKNLRVKIKSLFSGLFLAMLLSISAYAITAGSLPLPVFADNGTSICAPQTNADTNVGTCINRIYVISLAAGGFIAVVLIIVAGYLYMTGGKGVETAKKLIASSITGLVVLFGTFAFLNTINPDLTSFTGLSLPPLTCTGANGSTNAGKNLCATTVPTLINNTGTTTPGSTTGTGQADSSSQAAAKLLLADNGHGITLQTSGDCSGTSPLKSVTDIAAGNLTERDTTGSCTPNQTTNISSSVLMAIHNLAQANLNVVVTSLTTGTTHSNPNDPHYLGLAVDVAPVNRASQDAVVSNLFSSGASEVAEECNYTATSGTKHAFIVLNSSDQATSSTLSTSVCTGSTYVNGYHIHAQWSS